MGYTYYFEQQTSSSVKCTFCSVAPQTPIIMNYAAINQNYARLMQTRHDARIQDEAWIANEIQQETNCTRTEALKAAKQLLDSRNET